MSTLYEWQEHKLRHRSTRSAYVTGTEALLHLGGHETSDRTRTYRAIFGAGSVTELWHY
jgi:hypothetical protein